MSQGSVTGGEALARILAASGVRHAFGVPAGKLAPFLRSLADDDVDLAWTGTRHEAAAAWMATAVFHATGRIAVCCAESGPGALNLVSGLGSAFANGLGVVAITPGAPTSRAYPFDGLTMDLDNHALFAPVTKWRAVVRDPARLPDLVRRAVREALTGRPGPVHLEVPADVLAATVEVDTVALDAPLERFLPGGRAPADPREVERAAALLTDAERPLVIAGGGVTASEAAPELRVLVERLGAAATTTQMGLGCVSTADPWFFGHGGVIGGEAVVRALGEADAVLAVGCRFSSWLWCGTGEGVRGAPAQALVQVDVDPTVIGRHRPVSVGLHGDAKAVLGQLLEAVPEGARPRPAWVASLVDEHGRYREALHEAAAVPGEAIHPAALAEEVAAWLPDDALVAYDGGHTSFWSNDLTPATEPRTRFHEPGMAHLGFGTPYSHALALLHPGRTVVNVTGDGAFGLTLSELDTARRLGLRVIHVIHDNAAWGVIRLGQRKAGFELGTDLSGVDYATIARAFGCHGERVTLREDVRPALERAAASGLPAVVDVAVRLEPHPALPRFAAAGR